MARGVAGDGGVEQRDLREIALAGQRHRQDHQRELGGQERAGAAVHHPLDRRQLRDVVEARQHDQPDRGPRDRPRAPRRLGERRGPAPAGGRHQHVKLVGHAPHPHDGGHDVHPQDDEAHVSESR
jgi:hypothetical protein